MSKQYTYCPNCGNNLLRVTMTTTGNVLFPREGSSEDPQTQDIEPNGDYHDESPCSCEKCRTDGVLAEFRHDKPLSAVGAESKQIDNIIAAATRLLVGVTGKSGPACDWYEGIKDDATSELRKALGWAHD